MPKDKTMPIEVIPTPLEILISKGKQACDALRKVKPFISTKDHDAWGIMRDRVDKADVELAVAIREIENNKVLDHSAALREIVMNVFFAGLVAGEAPWVVYRRVNDAPPKNLDDEKIKNEAADRFVPQILAIMRGEKI